MSINLKKNSLVYVREHKDYFIVVKVINDRFGEPASVIAKSVNVIYDLGRTYPQIIGRFGIHEIDV